MIDEIMLETEEKMQRADNGLHHTIVNIRTTRTTPSAPFARAAPTPC